jgi:hypothetical protein
MMSRDLYKLKEAQTTEIGDVTVDQITEWARARAEFLYERIKRSPTLGKTRSMDTRELHIISNALEGVSQLAMAAKLDSPAILDSLERLRATLIEKSSAYQTPEIR